VPEPGLISDYLAILAAELPEPIVAELADGLEETYRHLRGRGLRPEQAASLAVTEFGEPQVIAAGFTQSSQGRRTARTLLVIGPAIGAFWGTVLIADHAWDWPVPLIAGVPFGVALLVVIVLLVASLRAQRYKAVRRASVAACTGTALLDAAFPTAVLLAIPHLQWPVVVAAGASAARLTYATHNFHRVLMS
jgi:hypothetical protein